MFTPDAISPQQRLAASHAQSIRQLARVRLPLYGLPAGWTGFRSTGSTCFERGITRDGDAVIAEVHETVELIHEDGPSQLRVESSDRFGAIDDATLTGLLEVDAAQFEQPTVTLDGRPVAFAAARAGERFVARWAGYDATVTVTAHRWPMGFGLQLERIVDLTPYHDGRLRQLEQASGFRLT